MKTPTLCTIALVLVSAAARSDPTAGVAYLMHEPVSLFDWGLMRLEQDLRGAGETVLMDTRNLLDFTSTTVTFTVTYAWTTNTIHIKANLLLSADDKSKPWTRTKELARRVVTNVRDIYRQDYYGEFFLHIDSARAGQPDRVHEELHRITTITVTEGVRRNPVCAAPLAGTEIRFAPETLR